MSAHLLRINGESSSFRLAQKFAGPAIAIAIGAALVYVYRRALLAAVPNLPSGFVLLAANAISIALVCAGQVFVHRHFRDRDFVRHNEVGGFIIAVVGSMYAVVLGFLTLVAWQHYSDARQLVAGEAAAAVDAWHVSVGLPGPQRTHVRQDVLEYCIRMVYDEWPLMYAGESDLRSGTVIMDAIGRTESFVPANLGESNAQSATLQQLSVMHDDRQRRLADNSSGIARFEWMVLALGAACVLCFCWLFGLANAQVHLLMTSAVTIVLVSTLVLLFELQFPFRGGLGIPPGDWNAVIDHIHWMQSAPQMNMRM